MLLSRDVTDTVDLTFSFRWLHAVVMNPSCKRDCEQLRENQRRYCDHCDKIVPKSTYYQHRAKFYDADSKTWTKQRKVAEVYSSSSEDSSLNEEPTESCRDVSDYDNDDNSSNENPPSIF